MPVKREIVEFPGPNGANLVGVLSVPPPDIPQKNVLVIMSHGGLSHKVGANRAQYNLSHYFASRGYCVFRFDPVGMGDSDGTIPETLRHDLFGSIESGLFKASYLAAFDHLATRYADYSWVVSGVCGGAISSLVGGVESRHPIAGYALISCPVVLDGSRFDYSRREPTPFAMKHLRLYAAKIVDPRALWRLVTFQSEYGKMWLYIKSVVSREAGSLSTKLGMSKKAPEKAVSGSDNGKAAGSGKPALGLSPHFVVAAREAMKKSKLLFIYGDNDGFLWEFGDLYAAAHLSETQKERMLRIVTHANHMFIWSEWQQQAFGMIEDWIATEIVPTAAAS